MHFKLSGYVPPLRKLRRESNVSLSEILARGSKITQRFPKNAAALCVIEVRGTRDVDIIEALAVVYSKPFKEVAEASKPPTEDTRAIGSARQ
jgi:hypothetical protein